VSQNIGMWDPMMTSYN